MNNPKQATLFQSWGGKCQQAKGLNRADAKREHLSKESRQGKDPTDEIVLLDSDGEDQELVLALEESLAQYQNRNTDGTETGSPSGLQSNQEDVLDDGNVSFGIEDQDAEHGIDRNNCLSQWNASDAITAEVQGYDRCAGRLWIYPTNYPEREYQLNIVRQALVKNTLVTLPTGLGKTFIAAVIMYNYYRWFPEGKVVFMAPTKPLVAQQIEACYNIMGIPRQDTAEMTGSMNPTDRKKAWQDRRVFFLTPQVMINDLSRGTCMAGAIKAVVVDEAHKAQGNHAYCQVVRELVKYTRQFRVLALSATPGNDIKAIQKVVNNLLISHIELRSEDSPDIKPYTHERTVDKIVVPLGEELMGIKTRYTQVLQVVVTRLVHQGVLYNREVSRLGKYHILKARDAFRQNPPQSLPRSQYGVVEGDLALAMSLYHGYELLQLHGLRSLYNFLESIVSGTKASGRTRTELMKNADFNDVMEVLTRKFQPSGPSENKPAFLAGHPKLVKLEAIVLEHFQQFQAAGQGTRVMIFSQYRDSVQEITSMLQQHAPLVLVMSFIGQASVGKGTKGFTQKEQLKVMQAFRTGGYNTLVSTCVGEEGLDIGDVDLIVCYDAHKSPVRLVQRMGRTGRKRQGRIVMLMTEGKEEQIYNHSQYTRRSIHRAMLNGAKSLVFYGNNPGMIPADVTPACHRMHITVQPPQAADMVDRPKGRARGRPPGPGSRAKAGKKKRHGSKDGAISLEEFVELKSMGCAVTASGLPRPAMLSLNKTEQFDADGGDGGELSLADWLPWQNSLQETSRFGHSRRSRHLVELMEFTGLQEELPEEDNYGQEMNIYLDVDDVLTDSKCPVSNNIAQFVMPSPRNQATGQGQRSEKPKRQRKRQGFLGENSEIPTRKKQRLVVQNLEISEHSDDSDFLPEIDVVTASVTKKTPYCNKAEEQSEAEFVFPQHEGDPVEAEVSARGKEVLCSDPVDGHKDVLARLKALDSELPEHDNGANRTEGNPDQVPPPPPVEDICQLLSLINVEDLARVDIQQIVGNSEQNDMPCHWSGPSVIPRILGDPDDSYELESVNSRTVQDGNDWWRPLTGVSQNDDAKDNLVERKTEMRSDMFTNFALDLEDIVPEMAESKEVFVLGSESVQSDPPPVVIQTSLDNTAMENRDSPSDSTLHSDRNLDRPERTTDIVDEQQMKSGMIGGSPKSSQSTPGTQHGQLGQNVKKTPGTGHKSFLDLSASDSFFHKNFFDDDGDFEQTDRNSSGSLNKEKQRNASSELCQTPPSRRKGHSPTPVVANVSAVSPVLEESCGSKNSSLFTFTQALSFVHSRSSSDPVHSDKMNTGSGPKDCHEHSRKVSEGLMAAKAVELPTKDASLPETHGDEELPNFDLGFDFDEDIIPPSPEAEAPSSVSQLTVKSLSCSSRPVPLVSNQGNEDPRGPANEIISHLVCPVPDSPLGIKQDAEQNSTSFSSSFQPRQHGDLGANNMWSDSLSKPCVSTPVTEPCTVDFFDVCLPKIMKRKLALNSRNVRKIDVHSEEAVSEVDIESSGSFRAKKASQSNLDKSPSLVGKDHLPKVQSQLKLSSIGTALPKEDHSFLGLHDIPHDNVLLSDDSDLEVELGSLKPVREVSHVERSPESEEKGTTVFCSTPAKKTQQQRLTSPKSDPLRLPAFPLELEDDDFEKCVVSYNKSKRVWRQRSKEEKDDNDVHSEQGIPPKKKLKLGEKKRVCDFLDDEAELSGDNGVSSDEDEVNTEMLEGSFIDNCTELTQASQIDMQAVYMKSLWDAGHHGTHQKGRYRLQLSPAPADVYSQLPSHLDEESQYQQDSFCVGSEEESSIAHSEEEDSLLEGGATASKKKRQRTVVKQMKGRKRVRQLVDSSSDEDESFDRLPPSQVISLQAKASVAKALLSSSDEHQDSSVADVSFSPWKCHRQTTDCDIDLKCQSKRAPESGKSESSQGFSVAVTASTETPESVDCFSKASRTGACQTSKLKLLQKRSLLETKNSPVPLTSECMDKKKGDHVLVKCIGKPHDIVSVETCSTKCHHSSVSNSVSKSNMPAVPAASVDFDDVEEKSFGKSGRWDIGSADTVVATVRERVAAGSLDGGNADQSKDMAPLQCPLSGDGNTVKFTSIRSRAGEKMIVLVDSREISGAQDIVSALRLTHYTQVCIRQLAACDYILSNRMAVERVTLSYFCNGSNRGKLLERLQQMQRLYDRCVIIVEKDRVKPGEEKLKKFRYRTKYVDCLITQLSQTAIRFFFTNNQNETASMLAQCTTLECRKGMAITVPVDLSSGQEQVVRFYQSIPRLSIIHALNLCFNFTNIGDFMRSSVNGVQTKGHMSFTRATKVVNYVRRRFSLALRYSK